MNWNKIKGYVISIVIGIVFTGALSLIPFYYYAKNTLAQHSGEIKEVEERVEDLSETIRDNEQAPIVIQGEIKVIKKDIEYIRETQQDQKVQLSKMLDILIDLKKANGN